MLAAGSVIMAIAPGVAAMGLALVATGLALVGLTLWFWSSAKPEPAALAPLEIMSDRRYLVATADERSAMVESVRGLVSSAPRQTSDRGLSSAVERRSRVTKQADTDSSRSDRRAPIDPLLK